MNKAQTIFYLLTETLNHDALADLQVVGGPSYFMAAKRFAEEEGYFTVVFDTKDELVRYILRAHPTAQTLTVEGRFTSMEALRKHEAVIKVFASILNG